MNNTTILSEHLSGIKDVETIVFSYLDHNSLTVIFQSNTAAFHEILYRIFSKDEPILCFQHWDPIMNPEETPSQKLDQLTTVLKIWSMEKLNVQPIYAIIEFSDLELSLTPCFKLLDLRQVARYIIARTIEKHSKHVWDDWRLQKADHETINLEFPE